VALRGRFTITAGYRRNRPAGDTEVYVSIRQECT
jgi:hypothetical protein